MVLILMFILSVSIWQNTRKNSEELRYVLDLKRQKEQLIDDWLSLAQRDNGNIIAAIAAHHIILREKVINNTYKDLEGMAYIPEHLASLFKIEAGKLLLDDINVSKMKYFLSVTRVCLWPAMGKIIWLFNLFLTGWQG
ncbi:hypothetical protein ACCY16_20025 [Candidatus Pantoea formicae]|uniref:hypothetical protein n=1 Tax=Candidatus Pantoea formicae TaxID=2608355 RepID=UPI003ED88A36